MSYKFPWTNYHELNLDWILDTVKKLFAQTEQNNAIVEQYDGRLTEVELTADNAQTAAEQAQQNSTAALDLAQGAQTTATQAQQAAAQAQQAAGQAQTAAGQAQEAAATAQQTATQAQQTAQNFDGRIRQAEDNAASALQAAQAFDEQVQGAITAANNANEAATAALTTSAETARELAAQRDTLEDIIENAAQSLEVDLSTKADVIINTAEGEIASFNDGADDMPIKKLVVNIEPVQSGSGDPSPTNVRPISGWTGAEISGTGINIWDEEWESGTLDSSGLPITNDNMIRGKDFIPVKPNTSYFYYNGSNTPQNFWCYGINKEYLGRFGTYIVNNTFTTPENCYYIRIALPAQYGTIYKNDISINYPATDIAYHAYTGNQISVTFPSSAGTVYGGTLTINPDRTGTLVVDRAFLDTQSNRWSLQSINSYGIANFGYYKALPYEYDFSDTGISNVLPYQTTTIGNTQTEGYTVITSGGTVYVRLNADKASTVEQFKEWATANNLQILLKLATPITYQLTESEISGILSTLYGTNNIWSSTGDTEVTYPADTKTYIDNKFAELQALILEH